MTKMTPGEMAKYIGRGLLSFPVTPFKFDLSFDEAQFRSNMDWLCSYDVAGLFAAGGTGEFFSLTVAEAARVTKVAVEETKGRVPVLAGVGYGTAVACEMAKAAERALDGNPKPAIRCPHVSAGFQLAVRAQLPRP
jgi:5-dehydro-4-deoxyglucarate dehydratase